AALAIGAAVVMAYRVRRIAARRDDAPTESAWTGIGIPLLMTYGFANILVFLIGCRMADPEVVDGRYVLVSHGHVVKQISPDEYSIARDWEARFASSVVMVMSAAFATAAWGWAAARTSTGAWKTRLGYQRLPFP